jgi:hypothetical protein
MSNYVFDAQSLAELIEFLHEGATLAAANARKLMRRRRKGSYKTRRPGADSLMWNGLASALRTELQPYGSKVRLARYLGLPKQRLTDYLTGRRRMPDAEITLRILHWLVTKRAGRDLSL